MLFSNRPNRMIAGGLIQRPISLQQIVDAQAARVFALKFCGTGQVICPVTPANSTF